MKSLKVCDYMNLHPVTFNADMTIAFAVELFLKTPQIGGPVIDDENHVIGFISEQDCLASMLESTYHSEMHVKVADKMHGDVLTANPGDSIVDIAKMMTGNKPKIFPVVDKNNQLTGIISRHDVLNAIDVHLNAIYEKGHPRFV